MKWLLRFATATLLMTAVAPLEETFDCWDEPGLANDSEFALFAFALAICLVLLVCTLIAAGMLKTCMISIRAIQRAETAKCSEAGHTFIFAIPPLLLVPLRI